MLSFRYIMLDATPLHVATLNVRGLGSKKRQMQLNELLQRKGIHVLAVQETKVESEEHTNTMVQVFLEKFYVCVSHAVGTAGGCLLFLKKEPACVVESVTTCVDGRFICCDFHFGEQPYRAVCVYAPTKPKPRRLFFEDVVKRLECDRHVFFLGDFNCVCNAEDRTNENAPFDPSALFLNDSLSSLCLEDVASLGDTSNTAKFTHYQGKSHARLDRVYVSSELAPFCNNYAVEPVSFSDHCLVSVWVGEKQRSRVKFNWNLWKLNDKLLKDDKFLRMIAEKKEALDKGADTNNIERWERFKQEVKMIAIERSTELKFNERKEEKELRNLLLLLTAEEAKAPGLFSDDIRSVKAKIENLEVEKYKGAAIRARSERLLAGEAPTKRSMADEKRHARSKEIPVIIDEGLEKRDQVEIENVFVKHYRNLFAYKPPQEGFESRFLNLLPCLEEDVTEELERPITLNEIEDAIDSLNNGKSPGPDGLGAAFYKTFKDGLAPVLHNVFQESFQSGALPPSCSKAHTILIPKTKDTELLKKVNGYRPITLTNTDYKVFMKVLAKRLQSVMKTLVGPHQTCGIKGRSIYTNIHVTRSILETCDIDYRKVAMLQIDFQKAFDKVSHNILFRIINHVGMGKIILEGVRMAYHECSTKFIVNGQLTSPVDVRASVRQGCALSSLLFALYLEPLCNKINGSTLVQGFALENSEVKVMAYADDVAIFCSNQESVSNALTITQDFCDVTGSTVNLKKCVGLWHGEWLDAPQSFKGIKWSTEPASYLGVPLQDYRDTSKYWSNRAQDVRTQTEICEGRNLSIFARVTICNVFFVSKLWYVMQALSCSRLNVQRFHRIFAVFVWQSTYERTSRSNLFRKLQGGGLSLAHLFVRQLVSRFFFLRDQADPFVRTFLQCTLGSALPEFVVTTADNTRYSVSRFLREVVFSCRFLMTRFSTDFLSSVNRKKLSTDLIDSLFPEPMYRSLYRMGSGQDVLRRVKRMPVPGGVKTFFFKLHTETLPVKTWMLEKGLFLPWGADCSLCKKPENIEHVFIQCWDAIFFWDVLQRTLKKDFPLTSRGIRFLDVKTDVVPYDLFFILGLHSIWKSRMEVRNADVNAKSVGNHFVEHICKLREIFVKEEYEDEVLSLMNDLAVMKVHKTTDR